MFCCRSSVAAAIRGEFHDSGHPHDVGGLLYPTPLTITSSAAAAAAATVVAFDVVAVNPVLAVIIVAVVAGRGRVPAPREHQALPAAAHEGRRGESGAPQRRDHHRGNTAAAYRRCRRF